MEKFKQNPKLNYFIAYSLSFIMYGMTMTSLGPLIPYLAHNANRQVTDYSVLFFSRAVGFFISGFLVKILQNKFTLHHLIIGSSVMTFIFLTLFSLSQQIQWQCFFMLMSSIGCCCLQITINIAMLVSHVDQDQQFWMQLNHGMFGVGGLIGPIIVKYFQTSHYIVVGILVLLITPAYCYLETPQTPQLMKSLHLLDDEEVGEQKNKKKLGQTQEIPKKVQYMICFIFYIYIGLEVSFGGWISPFAVLKNINTKQEATKYTSFFWISITAFRFLSALWVGKTSDKLITCAKGCIAVTGITCIIIIMDWNQFAALESCFFLGFFYAPIFPLLLTLPTEFNMNLNVQQSANIMIFCSIGEASTTMAVGILMQMYGSDMLFYSLLIFAISQYILSIKTVAQMRQNKMRGRKQQMITISNKN